MVIDWLEIGILFKYLWIGQELAVVWWIGDGLVESWH